MSVRVNTELLLRTLPDIVPPTKPPISLILACSSFFIFVYSAIVSDVRTGRWNFATSFDHGTVLSVHALLNLFFPVVIFSSLSISAPPYQFYHNSSISIALFKSRALLPHYFLRMIRRKTSIITATARTSILKTPCISPHCSAAA